MDFTHQLNIMRIILIFLLLGLVEPTWGAEIRIQPSQFTRMGIVIQPAVKAAGGNGARLPAQVTVPPAQIEVVTAPLSALVSTVRVAYGESVKKGQVLARLQGASFLEVQREFLHAQAQAALAAENRRRDEALFADGIIAQSRLSATIAAERQAAALLAEKRQSLRLAGIAPPSSDTAPSGEAVLRAPFDGVVLEALAQPGQRVDAQTPLFKLGRLAPLWLEIQASAEQATDIVPGDTVMVPGCSNPARVTLVAPQMRMMSQSRLIRAELAKPNGCVKPFQFVQAQVISSRTTVQETWRLPAAALVRHQGRTWLFRAVEGGFDPVPVEVVGEVAGEVSVKTDLPDGAKIATKGVSAIKAAWLGIGAEGK
ncbi:MAG: efflux RND transporter periplasmic adaptor subunit [Methylophilaceae bacterium]|nr:efflux RND transporter periplasmic adaptor subunit [Methylophilaceae bacterium]